MISVKMHLFLNKLLFTESFTKPCFKHAGNCNFDCGFDRHHCNAFERKEQIELNFNICPVLIKNNSFNDLILKH